MSTDPENSNDRLKIGFITIGCRANQADTARMISRLRSLAVDVDPWDSSAQTCDLIIVNTCAVTSKAEADARKLIRRSKRAHPESRIVVTGCAAQVEPDKWSEMPEVDCVVGITERDEIEKYLPLHEDSALSKVTKPSGGVDGPTPLHGHRSRPFLKIQDGCTRGCAYCIVPRARGPERSRSPELVREDIQRFSEAGYGEIVLTGVHLGRWGRDIGTDLSELLDILENIDTGIRIRLSSLEPMDLTPTLIKRIVTHPVICPHLHIPLQSGDQGILDSMGRDHTLRHYTDLLEAAVGIEPDIALGTDLMVGFPGENNKSHKNTLDFIKSLPLTYLHIFTYSPRALTRAADMPNRPTGPVVRDRMKDLKAVDNGKRMAFQKSQNGKIRPFLIESPTASNRITALSDNYLRIIVKDSEVINCIGQVVPLEIDINNDT